MVKETPKTLKLVTLNTWSGRALYPLMHFFRTYANSVDIFCLQEVRNSSQEAADARHPEECLYGPLFEKITPELQDYQGSFASFEDDKDKMSLASFWKKSLPLKTIDDFVIYNPQEPQEIGSTVFSSRKLQYLVIDMAGKEVLIANYHGLWDNGPKTDTPERIEQSQKIKFFLDSFIGPKIICGDFNLLPKTESLRILERGMRNLVTEYGVTSTRTSLYRHYTNQPRLADYILISPEISVKKFEVLPEIASDHAALYLEFSLSPS